MVTRRVADDDDDATAVAVSVFDRRVAIARSRLCTSSFLAADSKDGGASSFSAADSKDGGASSFSAADSKDGGASSKFGTTFPPSAPVPPLLC